MMAGWRLEHTYTGVPQLFYSDAESTPVRDPRLVVFNESLAAALGLDAEALTSAEGARVFAGNALPPGARPIAQGYAGHQFGHFTALGDGRAILLGEQITPAGGRPGARADAARIHPQRSDARARDSDDAQPRGRDDGRAGVSRDGARGGRAHA